jgi:orotate phosphoribosyltransferase
MLSYNESLEILKETDALKEGHFILSSGLHSSMYVQCALLLSYPEKAKIICSSLCEKLNNEFKSIDLILSPALGGVVVGFEVGRLLKKRTIFAERVNGILTLRRGFNISEKTNVLVVEDVITTGKSALECAELIKKNNASLVGYACIINRSDDKILIKDKIVSQIKLSITTYDEKTIPNYLKKIPTSSPGSKKIKNEKD